MLFASTNSSCKVRSFHVYLSSSYNDFAFIHTSPNDRMKFSHSTTLALAASLVSAAPSAHTFVPRNGTTNSTTLSRKLIVGGAGQIIALDFDGTAFVPTKDNYTDTGKVASWMAFKEPNRLYAVDENSNGTRLFGFDPNGGPLSKELGVLNGSAGVVHLAFDTEQTRLIGSSYGEGSIDVWDSTNPDGSLKYIKKIPLTGTHGPDPVSQTQLRAHQAVLDPTGGFFAVNDLGGDAIHILDTRNDAYRLLNTTVKVAAGAGPRHGAFISLKGGHYATHYVVVCELSNEIHLFNVSYSNTTGMGMNFMSKVSTYGPAFPPANATSAAAGELVVSSSGAIYVSNRLSGNKTDSISHFALEKKSATDSTPILAFQSQVSSGGIAPRMMSLSKDQSVMFATNVNGENGLVALSRDSKTGMLTEKPLAVMLNSEFSTQPAGQGFGPLFIQEL